MGECSTLKLVLERGPREGETLEFRPGSVVRLGRIVRGNSVAIKDVGISSKHLSIELDRDSGKWLITDLDSSNGTVLNKTKLPPNTPFPLSDGDTVKVGEYTSILVKICGDVQAQTEGDLVGESSELGLGLNGDLRSNNVVEKPKPKRRGRPKKGKLEENEVEIVPKKAENVKEIDNVEVNQGRQLRSRSTRNSKKEESVKLSSVVEDCGKQLENLAANGRKARKGRGKKNDMEDEASKNDEKEFIEEDFITDVLEVILEEEVKESAVNQLSEQLRVEDGLETEDVEQEEARLGAEDGNVDLGVEPDLEKMTLGEWFDFLEVYLPKQIYNETEELISNMKQRAKQFHEYSLQQKRAMEKGGLGGVWLWSYFPAVELLPWSHCF